MREGIKLSRGRANWVEVLDPYTWRILKVLGDGLRPGVRELHEKVGGSMLTLRNKLEQLERWKLIQIEIQRPEVWPFRYHISLNERGRKILDLIEKIRKLLYGR